MTGLLTRIERGEPVKAQEVFDYSVSKVIEQGAPAYQGGACVYRAMNGNKCAFGHLIPDSLYDPRFEGAGTGSLLIEGIDRWLYTPKLAASLSVHGVLIAELAKAHDHAAHIHAYNFLPHFLERAEEIAEEQGLTFTQGETK
jgi:hypothetical protein